MHSIAHRGCHDCAPKPWRHVPKLTGDYDFDATIMHRKNKDMATRIGQHLSASRGDRTGRRVQRGANHGNHGDD
jgi:hypothetical protein